MAQRPRDPCAVSRTRWGLSNPVGSLGPVESLGPLSTSMRPGAHPRAAMICAGTIVNTVMKVIGAQLCVLCPLVWQWTPKKWTVS